MTSKLDKFFLDGHMLGKEPGVDLAYIDGD